MTFLRQHTWLNEGIVVECDGDWRCSRWIRRGVNSILDRWIGVFEIRNLFDIDGVGSVHAADGREQERIMVKNLLIAWENRFPVTFFMIKSMWKEDFRQVQPRKQQKIHWLFSSWKHLLLAQTPVVVGIYPLFDINDIPVVVYYHLTGTIEKSSDIIAHTLLN